MDDTVLKKMATGGQSMLTAPSFEKEAVGLSGIGCEILEDKIYLRLKTLLIERRFETGEKIQPDRLAKEMGVSRTPVLNALKRLAAEHIIECIPRRGMFVARVSRRELVRLFEVREALECLSARLAATQITDAQVDQLGSLFRGLDADHTPEAIARYLERDRYFHWELVKISGNRYLVNAMDAVNVMIFTFRHDLCRPVEEAVQEHWSLLDALRRHDPAASESAMRLHISRTRELVIQAVRAEEERDA
jgi:GntR family transcriptional regulator, rspAB operon transcriptional repressor